MCCPAFGPESRLGLLPERTEGLKGSAGMNIWHLHDDTPRTPRRVGQHEPVCLHLGTYPIEPGQSVDVTWRRGAGVPLASGRVAATWERNEGNNSYWVARLGPFPEQGTIEYQLHARGPAGEVSTRCYEFVVGPKIHLALLWHMHQPDYRLGESEHPMLELPWVRLHALRDYYSMPAIVLAHPDLHVSFNLTPVLIEQLEAYADQGATDRHLELTRTPPDELSALELGQIVETFFDADRPHQISVHPRYSELLGMRARGATFALQDIVDLQMWSNLAWFGQEFRDGPVTLITGELVDVRPWIMQERAFSHEQIRAMLEEQFKVLRAVLPLYRHLQRLGQIELTTTPHSHPILPLLVDSDLATVDLPGATLPTRFSFPEDAAAQVESGKEVYERAFGRSPRGMWPAEGAVSQATIPLYSAAGIAWIASDEGVLSRSANGQYQASDPDVLCEPYWVGEADSRLVIFFRDSRLADAIGFRYQHFQNPEHAAAELVHEIEIRFIQHFADEEDRILSVVLDGENAWSGYEADGRPFLNALYRRLAAKSSILTVTPSEYLEGDPDRGLRAHPPRHTLHSLFTGSWADESGSRAGVELGTWIGEPAENQAWEMLGEVRALVAKAPPERQALVRRSLYAAEGSDWFWWLGNDQDSGHDEVFGELFRGHLRDVYRGLGVTPPAELAAARRE